MIKLAYTIPKDRFAPEMECWDIDSDFRIDLTRYENHANITVWHVTGDVTDQIFHQIKDLEYFF